MMYTIESSPRDVKVITCDRCGTQMREDQPWNGYNNRTQIRFRAGYASLFGDGNKVEGDLCDRCLYELLGKYLRVVESSPDETRAWGEDDTGKPFESFFDMQARRVYAPYQTPYAIVENIALTLREWIDSCFDLKWKRAPVVEPPKDGLGEPGSVPQCS